MLRLAFLIVAALCLTASCGDSGNSCTQHVECAGVQLCSTWLQTDPANCGACGVVCAVDLVCRSGACECAVATCDGLCVDSQSDPDHCGVCGTACGGGECVDGACSGGLVLRTDRTPSTLAIEGGNLYWTYQSARAISTGALITAPANGGSPITALVERLPRPGDVDVVAGVAYLADRGTRSGGDCSSSPGTVAAIDSSSGAIAVVAIGQQCPRSIDADADLVVWLNYGKSTSLTATGEIVRMSRATGELQVVAEGLFKPKRVRLGAERIYWLGYGNGTSYLMSALRDGTDVRSYTDTSGDDFWLSDAAIYIWGDGEIVRWDRQSETTTLRIEHPERPIALLGDELLWFGPEDPISIPAQEDRSCLRALSVAGGESRIIACTEAEEIGPVTADELFIYWAEENAIYRTPR